MIILDEEVRELVAYCHNTLFAAIDMLEIFEDIQGRDGKKGKAYRATLDRLKELRHATWHALFNDETIAVLNKKKRKT